MNSPQWFGGETYSPTDRFRVAADDFRLQLSEATRLSRRAQSAFEMLRRTITIEQVIVPKEDAEDLLAETTSRRKALSAELRNINSFERWVRSALAGIPEPSDTLPAQRVAQQDAFWGKSRSELQNWFTLSLEELSPIVGIAKATLVYIDRPGRSPRPSTLRKLLDLHALAAAVVARMGIDKARSWLSTTGLSALRDGGLSAFDTIVSRLLYSNHRSADSVPHEQGAEFALPPPKKSSSHSATAF